MRAIGIPDPLPPAITPPRTVIEFPIDQHLACALSLDLVPGQRRVVST